MTYTTHRHAARRLATVFLFALALTLSKGAHARSPRTSPLSQDAASPSRESKGTRAADEGDAAKAEASCARAEALSKQGDTGGALTALDESLKLYTRIYLDARTPTTLNAAAASPRLRSEMAARLRRAPACMELYARLGGPESATDFERGQFEALRAHVVGLTESDELRAIFFVPETDTRAVITQKPEPGYTEEARQRNVHGLVRLRAVLAADGEVKHILVLNGLPAGLTEKCVEAAARMKFTPAVKGGRPVSQFVALEYNFYVY